jgi:hypothetical protein
MIGARLYLLFFLVLVPQAWAQTYPAMEGYPGYSHYNNEYGSDRQG